MSLPNRMDPFATIVSYPEGSLVWFDPSGETQIVCPNMSENSYTASIVRQSKNLTYWDLDLPKSANINAMFMGCINLERITTYMPLASNCSQFADGCVKLKHLEVRGGFPRATNLGAAFRNTALESWTFDLPLATTCQNMLANALKLTYFSAALPVLNDAGSMFAGPTVSAANRPARLEFHSSVPKLSNGAYMFNNRLLDADSVKRVLKSIPKYTDGTHNMHIGVNTDWQDDEEIAKMLGTSTPIAGSTAGIVYKLYELNEDGTVGEDKGWNVTVQNDPWA